MTFEHLSLTLTTITAIAAILGPMISTVISIRANQKLKRMEMYTPRIYASIQKLSETYSQIPRKADYIATSEIHRSNLDRDSATAYRAFMAAAHELMSLIPDGEIHAQICDLLISLNGKKYATLEHDEQYQNLSAMIASKVSNDYSAK